MNEDSKLISAKDLLSFFKEKLPETTGCITHRHYENVRKFLSEDEKDDSNKIKNFLDWTKTHKYLKTSPVEVPGDILKDASIYDIKVQSRGPDDKIYDKHPEIRAKIPRGNCVLEYNEHNSKKYKLMIYALRKFTGGLGDEDDLDRRGGEWRKYFLKDIKNVKYVISLQKANGEAAHLSCSWINNDFLICAGSKNVHLVFRNKSDIQKYSDSRYSYARIISEAVADHLDRMDTILKNRFLSFLCWSKLTIILEILMPKSQHIEDLSNLKEPLLKFITFTENNIIEKPNSLCSIPPDCAIEIANIFRLSCVKCKYIKVSDVDNYLLEVRKGHSYEGVVLYFLDSDYNCIGLLKKKTAWYIIIRAVREKLRNYLSPKSTLSLSDLEKKLTKRIEEIQIWLGFSEAGLKKWEVLCISFVNWFDKKYKSNLITREDYSTIFPVIWNRFLNETNSTDRIDLKIEKIISSNLKDDSDIEPELDRFDLEVNSQTKQIDQDKDNDSNLEGLVEDLEKIQIS